MKQLTCEMCGSTELMKQDGVFVCQTCGTKYSVEDAKKMMIEGTVDVQGTVRVDDSSKIANYYAMAENAYDAGNLKESENYTNKVIEIDSTDYKAWFLKGKSAGWQSSLANLRVEESVNCFMKAIDNAPDEEQKNIKINASTEISKLSVAMMNITCDNFAKSPTEENAMEISKYLNVTKQFSLLLFEKCGVVPDDFFKEVAILMEKSAWNAWVNIVTQEYNNSEYPSDQELSIFMDRCTACSWVLKESIEVSKEDDADDIGRYKKLIQIMTQMGDSCSYIYSNGSYTVHHRPSGESKNNIINRIMGWHQKIKEIDPSYEIPQSPTFSSNNGCYVATAVYGSYDCPQVWTLRRYRDYTLAKTWYGRAFIHTYYAISPTLVKWFGHTEWFKNMWQGKLDKMVSKLQSEGVESTPYEDREW